MMTTPMTRDEIERAVTICPQCEGEGSYADGLDEDACTTDCTRCHTNGWIADLRALEAAGCQIVQGEPVAVLLSGGDYPDELEFWNHGTGCLTEADKAAGCTEVLLFAKVQP